MTPKYQPEKNRLDIINIKIFCASKDIIKKVNKQPRVGKNTCKSSHVFDKGLVPRIYKELLLLKKGK